MAADDSPAAPRSSADDSQAAPRSSPDSNRAAAVARDHFGFDESRTITLPGAVCAVASDRAIAVVSDPSMATIGGVLLRIQQLSVRLEAIVVESRAGLVDRWLEGFDDRPIVHGLDGRTLVEPVSPNDTRPRQPPAVPPLFDLVDVDVVIEDGLVLAEVAGLEVARVVIAEDGTERIEIGVGQYDRAGHHVMSAGRPLDETLVEVVSRVAAVRRPGARPHAFNRLCRERWLRASFVADPSSIGLVDLRPVDPSPPRVSLLDAVPAPAVGSDADNSRVLTMASVGMDPSLVVSAAAVAIRERPDRIVIAVPERDRLAAVERLLPKLRWPVEMIGTEPPWN